jgi:hypothetical protein
VQCKNHAKLERVDDALGWLPVAVKNLIHYSAINPVLLAPCLLAIRLLYVSAKQKNNIFEFNDANLHTTSHSLTWWFIARIYVAMHRNFWRWRRGRHGAGIADL